MRSVEVSGKTIDDAKQSALDELGVRDESHVEFEILEEAGRSMFGIKPGSVRVRATVHEESSHETGLVAAIGESEEDLGLEPDEETTQRVLDLIAEITRLSKLDVEVRHRANQGRYVQVEFAGRDAIYFTQRQAELLDSLQYLVNVLIGKKLDHNTRVILDAQNYRKRRAENLRNLAVSLSYQVKDRQEEAELDPLPAHERRIIHHALLGDEGVDTYSEGEEPHRYVVITPRRSAPPR